MGRNDGMCHHTHMSQVYTYCNIKGVGENMVKDNGKQA